MKVLSFARGGIPTTSRRQWDYFPASAVVSFRNCICGALAACLVVWLIAKRRKPTRRVAGAR